MELGDIGREKMFFPGDSYGVQLKENTSHRGGAHMPMLRLNYVCPSPEQDPGFFDEEVQRVRIKTALVFKGPTIDLLRLKDNAAMSGSFVGFDDILTNITKYL